jgi:deoxyhypusine synthase
VQNNPPEGLIAHTAGRDSSGVFRIFDIWETSEHAQRFQEERIMPIINELMQQRDDMTPPDVQETYELHDVVRA